MSGFNFNDLKKMRDKIGKALSDSEINNCLESTVKELSGRLLRSVIRNTPQGKTGSLRKGWTTLPLKRLPKGVSVDVVNDVSYAIYVENGHRTKNHKGWVEGQFMLEKAETEVKNVMQKAVKDKINKLLKGGFK